MSPPVASRWARYMVQIVGTPPVKRNRLPTDQGLEAGTLHAVARKNELGAAERRHERKAPGGGVIERGARHHAIERREAERARQARSHRMQNDCPVAVEHPLGIACGPRGVTKKRPGIFIDFGPGDRDRCRREQGLIGQRPNPRRRQRLRRTVRCIFRYAGGSAQSARRARRGWARTPICDSRHGSR